MVFYSFTILDGVRTSVTFSILFPVHGNQILVKILFMIWNLICAVSLMGYEF